MLPWKLEREMSLISKREESQSPSLPVKVVHWVIEKGEPRFSLRVKSVKAR